MVKANKSPYIPKGEDNFDPKLQEEGIEPPEGKGSATKLEFKEITYVEKSVIDQK